MLESLILSAWFLPVIIVLIIWEGIWKLIALWKSARNEQLAWFIAIGVLNTAGILPILYILFFQKKKKEAADVKAKKGRTKKRK